MTKKTFAILLSFIPAVMILLSACSSNDPCGTNSDAKKTGADDSTQASAFVHNIMLTDNPIIAGSTMYYADYSGIWMKESGKEKVQLSAYPADCVATDGKVVLYSYNDVDNSSGVIRRVQIDTKEDAELFETPANPKVITEFGGKVYYIAINSEKPATGLFSFDTASGENDVVAEDVFRCSIPVNNKIVYLDSGGSEFSTVGKLHLLDLSDGTDEVIDDIDYNKALYQIGDVVYTEKKVFGEDGEFVLYAYDMNTLQQKELYTMLQGQANKGVRIMGTFGDLIIYAIEDFYDADVGDVYYQYDTSSNEVNEITGLSSEKAALWASDTDALFVFGKYACRCGTLERVYDFGEDYPLFTAYFDGELYYQNEGALHVVYEEHHPVSDPYDVVLEDYLGWSMTDLIHEFGDDYSYVQLPETGLIDCLAFDALSNVAFGFSNTDDEVVLVSVKDCSDSVKLTADITSDLTGSDVLSLNESYSVSENYVESLQSYVVTAKRDDGLVLVFEWDDSDYRNKTAANVTMQRR